MPIDALLLRRLAAEWNRTLIGLTWTKAEYDPGRVRLIGRQGADNRVVELLFVLAPGLARIHRTATSRGKHSKPRPLPPFFDHLLPATVQEVSVVPWERIVHFHLQQPGDLGDVRHVTLIAELAGHMTNLILVSPAGIVIDALKRSAAKNAKRAIAPGLRYVPPPPFEDPCASRDPSHLPPLARQRLAEAGPKFWDTLCQDYATGQFPSYLLHNPDDQRDDVWVYPLQGWEATPVTDLEATIARVFAEKEEKLRRDGERRQYLARLNDRIRHLLLRIQEWEQWANQDGSVERELGDLWLTHQHRFANVDTGEITVPRFSNPEATVVLRLEPGTLPHEMAQHAYRRYKKLRNRREAALRMLELARAQLQHWQQEYAALEAGELSPEHISRTVRELHSSDRDRKPKDAKVGYRRFESAHGYPIWVGHNREENHRLTFREARPDDLWFHVKQVPGSHAVLFCGKDAPALDDLLDAAELVVFYSTAQHSSMVPVDYTRRKFVRKRPHGAPGEVLYRQEKTLYITPDAARLRRLGAVKERLADVDPG